MHQSFDKVECIDPSTRSRFVVHDSAGHLPFACRLMPSSYSTMCPRDACSWHVMPCQRASSIVLQLLPILNLWQKYVCEGGWKNRYFWRKLLLQPSQQECDVVEACGVVHSSSSCCCCFEFLFVDEKISSSFKVQTISGLRTFVVVFYRLFGHITERQRVFRDWCWQDHGSIIRSGLVAVTAIARNTRGVASSTVADNRGSATGRLHGVLFVANNNRGSADVIRLRSCCLLFTHGVVGIVFVAIGCRNSRNGFGGVRLLAARNCQQFVLATMYMAERRAIGS